MATVPALGGKGAGPGGHRYLLNFCRAGNVETSANGNDGLYPEQPTMCVMFEPVIMFRTEIRSLRKTIAL